MDTFILHPSIFLHPRFLFASLSLTASRPSALLHSLCAFACVSVGVMRVCVCVLGSEEGKGEKKRERERAVRVGESEGERV